MIEITSHRQGAILNRHHGEETADRLRVTIQGISETGRPVKVNGVPAQMDGRNFSAEIDLAAFGAAGRTVAGVDAVEPEDGAATPAWSQSGNVLKVSCDAKSFAYRIRYAAHATTSADPFRSVGGSQTLREGRSITP